MEKEIIGRITIHHSDRETESILDTTNAYDLKQFISFPPGSETTFFVGNKIVIEDTTYSIDEIYFDLLTPDSSLGRNISLSISVTELQAE